MNDGNSIWDGPSNADNDEQSDKDYWNEQDRESYSDNQDREWYTTTDSTADEWQPIADQIQFWADMDNQYWTNRREQAYRAYLERKLNK